MMVERGRATAAEADPIAGAFRTLGLTSAQTSSTTSTPSFRPPAHSLPPSLPPPNLAGEASPTHRSSSCAPGTVVGPLAQPYRSSVGGEDIPLDIARSAEASQIAPPTQTVLVHSSRHINLEANPEAPSLSYSSHISPPFRVDEFPQDSSNTDSNSLNHFHSPRSPPYSEFRSDTDGDSVGVQPCCRRTHKDRGESLTSSSEADGIVEGTNTDTSRRNSHSHLVEGESHILYFLSCFDPSLLRFLSFLLLLQRH